MGLLDLDALIAEVDRTCPEAGRRHGKDVDQPDWLALLSTAGELAERLQVLADDLVTDYVDHCRMHDYSWSEIGSVLGVTRQAAQKRFVAPHRQYDPAEFAPELREAMTRVKNLAIRQHNNYIGTEHLLWAITAEPTTATERLRSHDIAPQRVHDAVEARLSTGASQAAERFAVTPYARRALALAHDRGTSTSSAGPASSGLITCDDLLLGLAQLQRGIAAAVLTDSGLDVATASDPPARLGYPDS